jgi:hypothetical protein
MGWLFGTGAHSRLEAANFSKTASQHLATVAEAACPRDCRMPVAVRKGQQSHLPTLRKRTPYQYWSQEVTLPSGSQCAPLKSLISRTEEGKHTCNCWRLEIRPRLASEAAAACPRDCEPLLRRGSRAPAGARLTHVAAEASPPPVSASRSDM